MSCGLKKKVFRIIGANKNVELSAPFGYVLGNLFFVFLPRVT